MSNAATIPNPVDESTLWTGARDIIHFVGVCGAGKTTCQRIEVSEKIGYPDLSVFEASKLACFE